MPGLAMSRGVLVMKCAAFQAVGIDKAKHLT